RTGKRARSRKARMHALPQKHAAGLLGEISKTPDQDEVAQKIEEPIREIAHELEDRTFALRPLEQPIAICAKIHEAASPPDQSASAPISPVRTRIAPSRLVTTNLPSPRRTGRAACPML